MRRLGGGTDKRLPFFLARARTRVGLVRSAERSCAIY
jgi:hypothetical protein